jgi:hypothetical protein
MRHLVRENERAAESLTCRSIEEEGRVLSWIDCNEVLEMENEELFSDDFRGNLEQNAPSETLIQKSRRLDVIWASDTNK